MGNSSSLQKIRNKIFWIESATLQKSASFLMALNRVDFARNKTRVKALGACPRVLRGEKFEAHCEVVPREQKDSFISAEMNCCDTGASFAPWLSWSCQDLAKIPLAAFPENKNKGFEKTFKKTI